MSVAFAAQKLGVAGETVLRWQQDGILGDPLSLLSVTSLRRHRAEIARQQRETKRARPRGHLHVVCDDAW